MSSSKLLPVATEAILDDAYIGLELMLREDPANHVQRDITVRNAVCRADSVDEKTRSVESVISTDSQVTVFDMQSWQVIDEVLRMDGCESVDQVPLLENHSRWSLDSVLGSVREIKSSGSEMVARLYFAEEDEVANRVWNKVKQKHLRDVSAGYRVLEYTDIEPGQTAFVGGRSYTAGKRRLRISTRWQLKEVSVVPMGADQKAKIRGETTIERAVMNPQLKAFLVSLGLRADASDAEAQAFYSKLSAADQQRAQVAATGANPPSNPPANPPANPSEGQRSNNPPPVVTPPSNPTPVLPQEGERSGNNPPVDPQLDRIRQITNLGGDDIPRDMVNRALTENWTVERASQEFLGALRGGRRPSGEQQKGPAIHSRSRDVDVNQRSLSAGLLIQTGCNDPTKVRFYSGGQEDTKFTEQDADNAHRLRGLSAVDLARQCALIDTGRNLLDFEEAFRAAVSGGTLGNVFTTNIYAKLAEGWNRKPDTTDFCDEEEVANFQENEDISIATTSKMKKLPRGGTAKHATFSDATEKYRIGRFAQQFSADEQDFIDDRLGAIMRVQADMGEDAADLRPNMVYALMLSNPTMQDTGAVFNATAVNGAGGHANLLTGALTFDNLKAGITAMGKQREGNKVLNIKPQYLIVPADLSWKGMELLSPAMIAKLFGLTGEYSTENLLANFGLQLRVDDRIGAAGVENPLNNDTLITGSATNWFLAGPRGSKSLRVAYRRGTNRRPVVRQYVLDKGQWGFGWDINFDIGAAFMSYRTWQKSTGATA